eukprot:s7398_g2.t1
MSSYKKTEMSDYLAFPIDVPLRFISGDPSSVHETAQYKYVGENRGAYSQASQVQYVGAGMGNLEEVKTSRSAWRFRGECIAILAALLLFAFGLLLWRLFFWDAVPVGADDIAPPVPSYDRFDCYAGYHDWMHMWGEQQQKYCCMHFGRACPLHAKPPKVIYHHLPRAVMWSTTMFTSSRIMSSHTSATTATRAIRTGTSAGRTIRRDGAALTSIVVAPARGMEATT